MISKVEFFVDMTCEFCVQSITNCLKSKSEIKNFNVELNNKTVTIESTLPINEIQILLQSIGKKAILKGFASFLAAVCIIGTENQKVQGVIRFMSNDDTSDTCIIDGTIDGLDPIPYNLCTFEFGDISNECESVGSLYESTSVDGKKYNSVLGTFTPEENGRSSFRFTTFLNLSDLIGRSIVIIRDLNSSDQQKVACGIIARSAGIFQNPKTICACDGVSIWDENNQPKSSL